MGAPLPVARTVTGDVVESMRRYFLGVTIVAAFNGVVVGLGALVLGVPLAGTIAVVTFVTAYIPFIGAFVAGAFAVVLALGAKGAGIALVMLVIVLLANGLLQNIVQPIAFGATLNLHPLVTLVVTIGAGAPVRHGGAHPRRAADLGRLPHRARALGGSHRRRSRRLAGRRGTRGAVASASRRPTRRPPCRKRAAGRSWLRGRWRNRGSPVEIGKPQRRYTIEPIRDPVPRRRPREEPKTPQPPAPGRPGYEPTRQRA